MKRTTFLILVAGMIFLTAGCGAKEAVTPDAEEPDVSALETIEPVDSEEAPKAPEVVEAGENPIPIPVKEVVAEAKAAVNTAKGSVAETIAGGAAEVAATIEVAATKEGLTRIGDAKCKVCHKIQHASWAESSHAGLDPVLDCESCHGPGSEYKKMSIMKNREQAIAAGLVLPKAGFCKNCHTDDWDDGMLEAAHEHKPAS